MPADDVTVWAYKLAALTARGVPPAMAKLMSPGLSATAALANPERRRLVERHLRRADPTLAGLRLRRTVQETFDSYVHYWLESFRLPHLSPRIVERGFTSDGYDPHVLTALEAGNGAILALPHLGGWEWAGRWLVGRGHRVTVVVEQLDPPELFDWFTELRAGLGMHVVPLGPSAGREVLAALGRNDIVCLLCDRDVGGGGIEVEFFGEVTTLPAGPATLSLRSGAPILPTAVYFTDHTDGHLGLVRPPLDTTRSGGRLRADVGRITGALATELEHLIRRAPHQWHMFQPNWPSDPGFGGDA